MEETDILLAAQRMIRLHGAEAMTAARARVDAMRDRADSDGFQIWTRVIDAIDDLQRKRPPGEA